MDDLPKHRAINFKSTYNDSSYQHPLFLDKVLSTLSKENIMLFLPGEWYRTDLNTSVVDRSDAVDSKSGVVSSVYFGRKFSVKFGYIIYSYVFTFINIGYNLSHTTFSNH